MKPNVTSSNRLTIDRRHFLLGTSSIAAAGALSGCASMLSPSQSLETEYASAWKRADAIVAATKAPLFPARDFNIVDFGAVGDGKTMNTLAIKKAIAACHAAGGGRVVIPQGRFLTGPIHLLSNINLHLVKNATLAFSTNPDDYLPAVFTRWEGMEHMGYSPLIYAYRQKNLAITGEGTLDGQGDRQTWWPWKGGRWNDGKNWTVEGVPTQDEARDKLMRDMENNVPVEQRIYADGAYLRPPFVQPYECENIHIQGITIVAAPFWLLNPVLCTNVLIQGVTLESLGPNSDGCDPESCKNVVIEDCFFNTGDDCIAIKSGRNEDGRRIGVPSENIVIRNCKMRNGHGGVVIGSEMSGGVRNVFVENCEMSSPHLLRGLRIKTNSVRGGIVEHFYARDVEIGETQTAIVIDFQYEEGDSGKHTPIVRNLDFRNIHCKKAGKVFQVRGYTRSPITNFSLINSRFDQVEGIGVLEELDNFVAKDVFIKGELFRVNS